MKSSVAIKSWIKSQDHPVARLLYRSVKSWAYFSLPGFGRTFRLLYQVRKLSLTGIANLRRILWDTPLFRSQLQSTPKELLVYGGTPQIIGLVDIHFGERCRVSAQTTITGRTASRERPQLVVGSNCDIGWQTTIAVGTKVTLGNNVRIAGRAFLAGYPGHPLDAKARADGAPDLDSQCADIVLEDDVWLATNVTISAGVTIGKGTIVAAGSVVTRDLPPYSLAAGVPARPIRNLLPEMENANA
jgi:acetyltransferase-like isoleucine patch superfamily enzyme